MNLSLPAPFGSHCSFREMGRLTQCKADPGVLSFRGWPPAPCGLALPPPPSSPTRVGAPDQSPQAEGVAGHRQAQSQHHPQPAPTGPATLAPVREPRGPGSPTRGHRAPVKTRSGPSWGQRRTSSSQLWGFRPVPSWKLPPPPRPMDRAAGLSSAAWKHLREPLRNRCMNT